MTGPLVGMDTVVGRTMTTTDDTIDVSRREFLTGNWADDGTDDSIERETCDGGTSTTGQATEPTPLFREFGRRVAAVLYR